MDFLLMDFQFMDFQLIDYIVYRLQLLMDFQFMDFQFMEYLLMKVIVDRVHVDGFDWVVTNITVNTWLLDSGTCAAPHLQHLCI